jgi:hypothetical protein
MLVRKQPGCFCLCETRVKRSGRIFKTLTYINIKKIDLHLSIWTKKLLLFLGEISMYMYVLTDE